MTVLVTGATGFIGSHLAAALLESGQEVRVLVRAGSSHERLPAGVEAVTGDVRDTESLRRAVRGTDVVYHLASRLRRMSVPGSEYRETNVAGTENVLRAASEAGVSRVLHCSSTSVTGPVLEAPADETAPYAPGNAYEETKCEGEKLALAFAEEGPVAVTVVRPAWTYGPGDSRTFAFIRLIARGRLFMVGDGSTLVHPSFVLNVVGGMMKAAASASAAGGVYILADREPVPVRELAGRIAHELGVTLPRVHVPVWAARGLARVCEGVFALVGKEPPVHRGRVDFFTRPAAYSIARAREEFGYEPEVDLQEGMRRTILWYREHGML